MSIYIKSASAISIQQPLTRLDSREPVAYNETHVRCIEPDFKQFLDPIAARRMSRIIKRAIVTSGEVIRESGIAIPDAIISGTGLGCVEDTEKFLHAMLEQGEEFLQPTFFIQSTHNTISSQIAIRHRCHGHNNTHVHRGISFESALQEALLLFRLQGIHSALVGGYDELTPTYFKILGHLGYWRQSVENTLNIIREPGEGTFAGEGSVSLMLTDQPHDSNLARLEAVELFYRPADKEALIPEFLARHGMQPSDIDVILTGMNGDKENDAIYLKMTERHFKREQIAFYKPLCGDYATASAFGLHTALHWLKGQCVPAALTLEEKEIRPVRHILLHNHCQDKEHALTLIINT